MKSETFLFHLSRKPKDENLQTFKLDEMKKKSMKNLSLENKSRILCECTLWKSKKVVKAKLFLFCYFCIEAEKFYFNFVEP